LEKDIVLKQLIPSMTGVLLLYASTAVAGVYKCTGADGTVQYRDTPCDSKAQGLRKLDTPVPDAVTPDDRMEKTRRLLDAMREERQQKEEQAEEEKTKREQRRNRCNRARDNLRRMQQSGRLYRLDESGNRVYLPDSEREAEIAQMRKSMETWCD
jgi:hypothetical protein